MARALTPQDAYAVMNALVHQATGQASFTVTDISSFVSAGETVLNTGLENTLNALSIVVGRTLIAVRPYKAKLQIIQALNTNLYTSRFRKISYYTRDAQAAGDWNTNLNAENLKDGSDNSYVAGKAVGTMWEQNAPIPLEMNFAGQDVWDDSSTVYINQLKVAFRSPDEFNRFMQGVITERGNDMESQKEAYNRLALLNRIAGQYALKATVPESAVNLTQAFNTYYGTSYTSAQLRTTYLEEFLKFFVTEFKLTSDRMTNRSNLYHWAPTKAGHILARHTPKANQRAIMFTPLFTRAKADVFPSIFNPQYLNIDQFEGVDYWQSIDPDDAMKVNITCAIPDVSDPSEQTSATSNIPYVVGILYDKDALLTDFQFESANTTPVEARKRYYNIWYHFSKNVINDYTENCVLFYMEDSQ